MAHIGSIHAEQLRRARLQALAETARCVGCGCTDAQACDTGDGPCEWVETLPQLADAFGATVTDHLCTACVDEIALEYLLATARYRFTEEQLAALAGRR